MNALSVGAEVREEVREREERVDTFEKLLGQNSEKSDSTQLIRKVAEEILTGIWRCGYTCRHLRRGRSPKDSSLVGDDSGTLLRTGSSFLHESRASSALHSSPRSCGIRMTVYARWRSPSLTSASRAAVFNPLHLNADVERILPHSEKNCNLS